MAKRLAAFLLSAAMLTSSVPAFPVFAAEGTLAGEGNYVLMNIPFDEFYASEGVATPDVVTSATFKALNQNLAAGSYHDGFTYTEESAREAKMLGVTYPVYVEDASVLEGLVEVTDESAESITVAAGKTGIATAEAVGKDVLFASPTYAYYKLAEAPNRYKTLTVADGEFSFGPVTGDVADGGDLDVTMNYGGHHTNIEFIVGSDEVAGAGKVNAAILTTTDGQQLALRPVYHIWRLTQLGWDYAHWDIGGKTIASAKFYLEKDGAFDVIEYKTDVTIKRKAQETMEASFESKTSVAVRNLPEDIENPLGTVKTKVGRGETPTVIAENVPVSDGKIAATEAGELGKTYVVSVISDNYADLSAETVLTLSAPAIRELQNTKDGVSVAWSLVDEADAYTIYRDGEVLETVEGTVDSFLDETANENGREYVYGIVATKTDGETSLSSPLSENANIVFVAPTKISSVTNAASGTKVAWEKQEGAAGYYIYRNGSKVKTVSGAETVTFTDTGAKTNGTAYQYQVVVARKADGKVYTSVPSEAMANVFVKRPSISKIGSVSNGTKIILTPVAGAAGYYIYRDGKKVKTLSGASNTSFVDTGAKTNGKSYTYTVVAALKVDGTLYKSAASAAKTSTFLSRGVLKSLTNTKAKTLKVVWTKNAKADGYQVRFVVGAKTVTKSFKAASATVTVTKGKTYTVSVRPYKKTGSVVSYGAWSKALKVKITK